MGVPLTVTLRVLLGAAMAVFLAAAPAPAENADTLDVAVKAAFLFNFAKFTEWPALPSGGHVSFCVVGNDAVATALGNTVRGQNIGGHPLEIARPINSANWHACDVLFIADAEAGRSGPALDALKALPVLTVSDSKGFAQGRGLIELYVEGGRMRFAINVDAAERSGLRLSSRLLGLAAVVRDRGRR